MRLGLVAVVLLAACGPMPEDTAAPSAKTFPVRVSRLVLDQGALQPSVDPLRLTLKVIADGAMVAHFHYQGTPRPFDELGDVPWPDAHDLRVEAQFGDSSGNHSFEREVTVGEGPSIESLVFSISEGEDQTAQMNLVLVNRPSAAPPGMSLERLPAAGALPRYRFNGATAGDDPGPLLTTIGMGGVHTDLVIETFPGDESGPAVAHDFFVVNDDGTENRIRDSFRAGLYHLDVTAQRPRWLAPEVLQLDQYWLTDDFAIEN